MVEIIDGKLHASYILEQVARDATIYGRPPGLAVVLVGDDPASQIYVNSKVKKAEACGFVSTVHRLDASSSPETLLGLIDYLNNAPDVDGILVQLPLPDHIDPKTIIDRIDPNKDVDGFHPYNVGRLAQRDPTIIPCTPLGCMNLIQSVHPKLHGLHACVVGASNIVGRPMAQLLLLQGATISVVHRFTKDSAAVARQSDIVISAVGKPGLVTRDWIKPGATVIDVGINRVDGKIVGDVAFDEVCEVAGAITPVPGGVGPMTIAFLLKNTLEAYFRNYARQMVKNATAIA